MTANQRPDIAETDQSEAEIATHHPALRVVSPGPVVSQPGLEKFTQQLNFNIISQLRAWRVIAEIFSAELLIILNAERRERVRLFSSINGHFTDPFNYNNLCSATGNRSANINAAFWMFFNFQGIFRASMNANLQLCSAQTKVSRPARWLKYFDLF